MILERKLGRRIKPSYCALHHCGNRCCIEPSHIYEGTHKQNAQDRKNHGTQDDRRGSRNPLAKLTDMDIRRIRKAKETLIKTLAHKYKVSPGAIRLIIRSKAWSHL